MEMPKEKEIRIISHKKNPQLEKGSWNVYFYLCELSMEEQKKR